MNKKLRQEISLWIRGFRAHLEHNKHRWDPTIHGFGEALNRGGIAHHVLAYEGMRNKRLPEGIHVLATRIKDRETARRLCETMWLVRRSKRSDPVCFRPPTLAEVDIVLERLETLGPRKIPYKEVYLDKEQVGSAKGWFWKYNILDNGTWEVIEWDKKLYKATG